MIGREDKDRESAAYLQYWYGFEENIKEEDNTKIAMIQR